jgi:integrase
MTKVTLREKKLISGKVSLYLDFYPPIINPETGKPTRREFLGIHIHDNPKSTKERADNKDKKLKAELIKGKRQLEVFNEKYDFLKKDSSDENFLEYIKSLIEKRKQSGVNYDTWRSMYNYLERFTNNYLSSKLVNKPFVEDFKSHLLSTSTFKDETQQLHQNSASAYFNVFREAVNEAFNDGLIKRNPLALVKTIPNIESQREFLEISEVEKLFKMHCKSPIIKAAFLFACLTGLRKVDIKALTWSEVFFSEENGHYIRFRQKKTEIPQTLNIPKRAVELLGKRGKKEDFIFKDITKSIYTILPEWVKSAGIEKHITFHCARHTAATMHITLGTDLYTVSELLGHTSIKNTQIYAKIVSKKKMEAVGRFDELDF